MTKKLNANFIKMVNILSDGAYHDGNTIGEKLKLTRSAVWKMIKKLEQYAIKIDSIKGKGYALLEPLILLELNKIKKKVANDNLEILIFESMPSTNEYLKSIRHSRGIKICLTEQQTEGKGRLNRHWYSPFGRNIYLSCQYAFQKDISELAGLSLMTSLAIVKTLNDFGIREGLFVKWPNDIIYEDKKLSGGLVEVQAESHGQSIAIIGIGVNVNMLNDKNHITQAWTSMQKIVNHYIDRNEVCAALINNLLVYLARFNAQGFSAFTKEWSAMDCLTNQTITLKNINDKITGKVVGINEQGHLLMELSDHTVRAFSSGDTTIVKKPS